MTICEECIAMFARGWARGKALLLAVLLLAVLPLGAAFAASSEPYASEALTGQLVTAENAVGPVSSTVSAGLYLDLVGDWKAYWRSPGEVGLPPSIDWSASENVAAVEMLWPAPTRFRAFGIENFGYKDEVVLPLRVALERPGERAILRGTVSLLVCETICVPDTFEARIDLPSVGQAGHIPPFDADAAGLIARFAERVPVEGAADVEVAAYQDGADAVVVTALGGGRFVDPDIFPEREGASFGAPDIRVSEDGAQLWARLPVLSGGLAEGDPLTLTLTTGNEAVTVPVSLNDGAPPPVIGAAEQQARGSILVFALLAFVGGLILNVMPCVLPVLTIKLTSAIKLSGGALGEIRQGFIASAAGVLSFVMALAVATLALRSAGVAVGWGVQFQNPVFLTVVVVILAVFAANLLGTFEIALPSGVSTRLARAGGASGRVGDFLTGAFAALLATPCSAPFLGTAVAFALSGGTFDVLIIFAALGLGLALPYIAVALRPSLVRLLPRPGPWMEKVRWVLAAMLAVTALWLLVVLAAVSGTTLALAIGVLAVLVAVALGLRRLPLLARASLVSIAVAVALIMPVFLQDEPTVATADDAGWVPFDRGEIVRAVSRGDVVFVDVTADWCLTCKANKASTLDREAVRERLAGEGTLAMRADWTRPNDEIRRYLNSHDRFGIPFNIVYGPAAPDGMPLPELLTPSIVLDAMNEAG